MKPLLLAVVLAISWVGIAAARPATDAEARKGCMPQQPCPMKGVKWQVNQCVFPDTDKNYEIVCTPDQILGQQRGTRRHAGDEFQTGSTPSNAGTPGSPPKYGDWYAQRGTQRPDLPRGAVPPGQNPGAPEGASGVIGSFPGTKRQGDLCYTYCLSPGKILQIPVLGTWFFDPTVYGKDLKEAKPGDVIVLYRPVASGWQAAHYALYQGNGIVYFKNGFSDVYIGQLPDYLDNYRGWIVRVF